MSTPDAPPPPPSATPSPPPDPVSFPSQIATETSPDPARPPQPASSSGAPAAPRRTWLLPTATGVVGLVLGVGLTSGFHGLQDAAERRAADRAAADAAAEEEAQTEARRAVLADAVEGCAGFGKEGLTLGDDGATLTFDMKGEDDFRGASIDGLACIFGALEMPSNVSSHIDQTTSMDGRQTESWGDLTISWSYHPDRGLDGVLTVSTDH